MKTRLPKLLGMICAGLLVTSCCSSPPGAVSPTTEAPNPIEIDPSRMTPEACYSAFRKAWNSRDFETAFVYLSPRAQGFVGMHHFSFILLWQGMGTQEMHESPFGQALEAYLLERGIGYLGFLIEDAPLEAGRIDAFIAAGRELGPPLELTQDLYAMDDEHRGTGRLQFFNSDINYGRLVEVEVVDATALGWFGTPKMSGELSVEFIEDDHGWLIDMIHPFPLDGVPGGNQIRE